MLLREEETPRRMSLQSVLQFLKFFGGGECDDYIDQLHYVFTSNVLLALSILVSFKQFGGKPVECMVSFRRFTSIDLLEMHSFFRRS